MSTPDPQAAADARARRFDDLRPLLFTVAYELLGSAADAEDVVQEAWLRWAAVEEAGVRDARAYLVRTTTRLGLNRLRTLARRRESYVGPWLPEPLVTAPDVADDVALADSLSTAMLLVLETLSPLERAVFVLKDVFDVGYDEIAEAVDRTPSAVRQLAHRARAHVAERRPRREVARDEQARALERFLVAASTGDLVSLVEVLAPDVVLVTDGGGFKKAALRPILGRDKVLRFLAAVTPADVETAVHRVQVNGRPGLALWVEGEVDALVTAEVGADEHGVVSVVALHLVRNPHKLPALDRPVRLARGARLP